MENLKVKKYDNKINLKNLSGFQLIEKYNTACLLEIKTGFISLLAKNRKPIPDSIVLGITGSELSWLQINPSNIKLDFKKASSWDSSVRGRLNIDPEYAINIITNKIKPFQQKNKKLNTEKPIFNRLIGAGLGLTPAGDDFTIGVLGVAAHTSDELFAFVADRVKKVLHRTTSLSRHFLRLALQKRYSEDFLKLFSALEKEDIEEIKKNLDSILNYGHSSGYYTVKGILWALKKI